jgi:diaminohydroxyphosphoribosylaminopyrimidine deaminase/5-amino-6-(5-phosphoribosylamino)uracil reductase
MPTPEDSVWPRLLGLKKGEALNPEDLPPPVRLVWELYAPLAGADTSFVVAQLGQSLDGRIATPTGHSHYVNGPQAILHLHRLRALADAVVIGIGTVIADDPQLTVRLVEGPNPARIVLDPNGRLPHDARLLAEDGAPRIVIQGARHDLPPGVLGIGLKLREKLFDPRAIIAALVELGFKRLLIEGGGRTVSHFLAARALDRLHLTVAPLVIGSGPTGIDLPEIDHLDDALRPGVSIHRLGEDVLFDCTLARTR